MRAVSRLTPACSITPGAIWPGSRPRDPCQREGVALWSVILDAGPSEVVRRLLDRSAEGDYARQTAPSLGALPPQTRARLAQAAGQPVEESDA